MKSKRENQRSQYIMLVIALAIPLIWIGAFALSHSEETALLIAEEPPSWRGIIPGQSTPAQVRAILGPPTSISPCLKNIDRQFIDADLYYIIACAIGNQLVYSYQTDNSNSAFFPNSHEIHFKAGVVSYVLVNYSDDIFNEDIPPKMATQQLFANYGFPDKLAFPARGITRDSISVLYCRQGVMAVVDRVGVQFLYFFTPQSIPPCLKLFRYEIIVDLPIQVDTLNNPGG